MRGHGERRAFFVVPELSLVHIRNRMVGSLEVKWQDAAIGLISSRQ